jgi:hypothetical protein
LIVWLLTTKSQESTRFPCVHTTCDIPLESSRRGLQLFFRLHRDRRSAQEFMRPQSCGSPGWWNFGTPTWESRDKNAHLDVVSLEWHKIYYKGEGGGFPQVRAVVNIVCPSCLWFVLAPKVFQLCTNHLVLVLCRFVWVNKACHFFLVSSRSSSTPLYPSIVLRARGRALTPCPSIVFSLGLTFESRKELGVRQKGTKYTIMRGVVPPPKGCGLCKVCAWGCPY